MILHHFILCCACPDMCTDINSCLFIRASYKSCTMTVPTYQMIYPFIIALNFIGFFSLINSHNVRSFSEHAGELL